MNKEILKMEIKNAARAAVKNAAGTLRPANYKRHLKGRLQDYFQRKGFSVTVTDTPEIVLFSKEKINEKSVKYSHGFITSFGVGAAEKILGVDFK